MRLSIIRILDSRHAVTGAMLLTLVLGYFFIFVWAPHPWSWQGIDAYHELAKALARGEPFQTLDVPWGYAYYAAFFYRLFGERIWVPLVCQATLNGAVPWLLYRLVAPLAGTRVATLAALLAGVFSFNTIYASTQSSDTICTVMFLAGLLAFMQGIRGQRIAGFAIAGLLFGLVPQFRPNMVLFPGVMIAAYLLWRPFSIRKLSQLAVFGALVLALQLPWIVRNYRMTGLFLPTSTHGGMQLWYGSLQVGPYLESRAHNPRLHFESPPFPYSSLWRRPLEISADSRDCGAAAAAPTQLIYWTDRDSQRRAVAAHARQRPSDRLIYELPAQPNQTTLYYYFEQRRRTDDNTATAALSAPPGGAANPMVAFIADDHLGDLDRHDDLLDVFDLIRVLRHVAWQEPLRAQHALDLTNDGRVDDGDVTAIVSLMIPGVASTLTSPVARVEAGEQVVTLTLADGSWIAVPREFSGNHTDVSVSLEGGMAAAMLSRHRTFSSITHSAHGAGPGDCPPATEAAFNQPFYLSDPHMMNRYLALAFDNINRDRWAFVRASLYRTVRLFIVRGTGDRATAYQFNGSAMVYATATALSMLYFVMFAVGVFVAVRRYRPLLWLLVPVVYVPVTICFVLTNMRYTVTVQPLMFAFVAAAVAAALRLDRPAAGRPA